MLPRLFAAALAAVSLMGVAKCHASPVVYTLSGTFSGTLGSALFIDDPAVFTFQGDTAGITNLGNGFYANTAGLSTLNLAGLGTATFASLGAESEFDAAAFYDISSGFAVGLYNEAIGSYDLSAPFGPVSGFFAGPSGTAEATSLGVLSISGAKGDVVFTANAVTPEPPSLMLLVTGLLCIGVVLRRRLLEAHTSC